MRSGSNEYEEDIDHLNRLFVARKLVTFDIGRIVCTPGSSSGDNYMSLVKRVTIYDAADVDKSEMGKAETDHARATATTTTIKTNLTQATFSLSILLLLLLQRRRRRRRQVTLLYAF